VRDNTKLLLHSIQDRLRGLGNTVAGGDGKTGHGILLSRAGAEDQLLLARKMVHSTGKDNQPILGIKFSSDGIIMDRLEAMTILLRVVDRGSFSAASRDLGVPLATVSRKVNELETHLGTKLLLRTSRKVALTDAGATYVASARRILDDIDE